MSIYVVTGNSLVVQWLARYAFAAVGLALIPGWGTNIAQAMRYASLHPKRKIKNPCCCKWHYFIFFCSQVIFHCVCVCLCIYHIIFIHSSVDEHLGCFHVLAIVNIAAVNIVVHVSF